MKLLFAIVNIIICISSNSFLAGTSHESSHVQSAKSRLKGPLAHDGDIQALHRSHNHGYRQPRNIGTRISGRSRRFSHRRNIGNVFTPWTSWNSCDSNCKQRRERYCKVRRKCGQMKHMEERSCPQEYCRPSFSSSPQPYQEYNPSTVPKINKQVFIQSDQEDEYDDRDYFVIKKKPKKRKRKPVVIDLSDYESDHNDYENDDVIYTRDRHTDESSTTRNHYQNRDFRNWVLAMREEKQRKQKHKNHKKKIPQFYDDNYEVSEQSDENNEIPTDRLDKNYGSIFETTETSTLRTPNTNKKSDLPTGYYSHSWSPISKEENSHHSRAKRHQKRQAVYDPDFAKKDKGIGDFNDPLIFDDYYDADEFSAERLLNNNTYENLKTGSKRGKEKAVFDVPGRHKRVYTKWSKWSKCTPKCTTRRFKRCRNKEICANEVLREIAYCYTEGSFCERWIASQMQSIKPEPKPNTDLQLTNNRRPYSSNQLSNELRGRSLQIAEYNPQHIQCGFPQVRNKGKNYLNNMLRIIGGKTSRRGQWPWQVAILNRFKEAFCGGTLVSPLWVLSASHCVRKRLYVRLGEHNLEVVDGTELEYRVELSIKHPKYDKKTVDNDVAMLRLPQEIQSNSNIGFACLPLRYQALPIGTQCTIIGWGKRRNRDDAGTNILHEAEVPIISNDECRAVYYDYTITKNMFCAGHKRGRIDTCAGDSGGPLLCRDVTKHNQPWTIFGITSFGDGCGKRNKFGIYTKLPNYVDWIWSVINCNGNCKS